MNWNRVVPMVTGALLLAACAGDQTTAPKVSQIERPSLTITGPTATGTKTCPVTGNGWQKIDNGSGSANGQWGSFSYSGPTVTLNVNSGYTLLLCVKSGSKVNDGRAALYTIAGPEQQPITIAQDISHTSWQVINPPTKESQNLVVGKSADGTYDRTVTWTLNKYINGSPTKSVSYTGTPGKSFPITWDIEVDKSELKGNFKVTGAVFVTNPNDFAVTVNVADKLKVGSAGNYTDASNPSVAVDCDPMTGGNQSTATVPPTGVISCTYEATRTSADATLNEAVVSVTAPTGVPDGYTGTLQGGTATDPVEWEENLIGDDEGILTDDRFAGFSQAISTLGKTSKQFPETFTCSKNPSDYNSYGVQVITVVNTATLDLDPTDLTSSAQVVVTCSAYAGETATGKGLPWAATGSAPNNWFMYTPWATQGGFIGLFPGPVDLIAGQSYDVGDIVGSVADGQRTLTLTLQNGAKFTNVSNNVKIVPLTSCTAKDLAYVQPGQYTIKTTATAGSIAVPVPSTVMAKGKSLPVLCYGIHVDAQRFLFN